MDNPFLQEWSTLGNDDSRYSFLEKAIEKNVPAVVLSRLLPRYDRMILEITKNQFLLSEIQMLRKQSELSLGESLRPEKGFTCQTNWHEMRVTDQRDESIELDKLLENPDAFIAHGKIIKSGTATTVAIVHSGSKSFFIKRYNCKSAIYNLFRSFIPSRAAVTWHAAQLLESIGVPTARSIALLEKRKGPFKQESYVVHEYLESIHAMKFFAEGAKPCPEWQPAAKEIENILYSLQRSLIIHGDLKGQNFIINNNLPLLIDLDSLKSFSSPAAFKKQYPKDLARFERNWQNEVEGRAVFQPVIERLRNSL